MQGMDGVGGFAPLDFGTRTVELDDNLPDLAGAFKSDMSVARGVRESVRRPFDNSVANAIGLEDATLLQEVRPKISDLARQMRDGAVDGDGNHALGIKQISEWKVNDQFRKQNINQHAGYAAEVTTTAMENMDAAARDTGITTWRADDRPDLGFKKNDQFVDKVRVNESGEVVDRVQVKFVGRDGADWVSKMMGKKFDKYFEGDHVDKIECPKDYYKGAKESIAKEIDKCQQQLERVSKMGNDTVAQKLQNRIDKLNKLDSMVEESKITKAQARDAAVHPDRFVRKFTAGELIDNGIKDGINGGAITAGLTFAVSTAEHVGEFLDGEIEADEMVGKIAGETGVAGAIGTGTGFVTSVIANGAQASSHELIRRVGGSCLPAAAVSFCVESYDSVMDFSQGVINGGELAHDLGHNAASVAGGVFGGAKAGALAGTALGPAGTVVGGIAGGVIGAAVATGVYEMAVEYVPEAAEGVLHQLESCKDAVMDAVHEQFPEKEGLVQASLNQYFTGNNVLVRA